MFDRCEAAEVADLHGIFDLFEPEVLSLGRKRSSIRAHEPGVVDETIQTAVVLVFDDVRNAPCIQFGRSFCRKNRDFEVFLLLR